MEKEELERELEKAEKGCVITVINQSSLPLNFDGSKHSHGKFKAKPPKTIIARETASFSLEGRKSIEASVKFRWGKGRLELFWNMPDQGDPKIFYRVAPQLKNKLFVYIPSAVFGKITKFIFLVDEKPATPLTPQELSSNSNPDTNDDLSSEHTSDSEDMHRSNSAGEIPTPLTPKVFFDPSQLKSPTAPTPEPKDDDNTNSFGFSSDEEDEPKKINIVIKPKADIPVDTLITPVIPGIKPPTANAENSRRRPNTKSQRESNIFGDLNEQLFQQSINAPVLSPTPAPASPPMEDSRERRLSFSGEYEKNKVVPNNNAPARNSLPLDGLFSLGLPPQLTPQTPPTPPQNAARASFALSPTPSPTPLSQGTGSKSFDLGRISFDDLRSLSSPTSGPLTPKPTSTPEITLAPRMTSPLTTSPLIPTPSMPKSPPIIASTPIPSSAAILVPTKPASANSAANSSPTKSQFGSFPSDSVGSPPSSSPARAAYHAPMSPPLQRQNSRGSNGVAFGAESPNSRGPSRRYSEPPPVDLNLLFPEIATAKDKNKKSDVLVPATKYIEAAMVHLEKNSIPAALGNLDLCCSLLGTLPSECASELEYCMRYRIFFVLLKEIYKPKPPMEHAFLSFFLTDIAVKPQHRIIAIRMAIKHNITSQNFGVAAGLIQFLVERVHPIDESALQEKFRKCLSQGRANADPRFKKYTCPGCEATSSVSSMKCAVCHHPIKFCALTLDVINTKAYYSCKLCKLNFSRKSISPRDSELKCPFCKAGDLTNKIFVANK